MAIPDVNGTSFWGGGTYIHDTGYVLLDNHGEIIGEAPEVQETDGFSQRLSWVGHDGSVELRERAVGQLGGRRRANLEVDLRVSAARRRRRHAQLARQQGSPGWRLRRLLLAVPGVPRRRGVHRGTRAASTTCTAVSRRGWPGRPISPPDPVRMDRPRWSSPAAEAAAAGEPWFVRVSDYPGLGSALAWDRPVSLRAGDVLTRRFDIAIADGRLTEGEVRALALAQGAG